MKLYEIQRQYEEAMARVFAAVDDETGEITDPESFEALEEIQAERDEKIEAVGCYIKNLLAEIVAIKAEEIRLKARREILEHKVKSLKSYIATILNFTKWDKSAKVAFTFRQSTPVIIDDETAVPDRFLRTKVETEPDKAKIKAAITAGQEVPGAHIEERKNISIV